MFVHRDKFLTRATAPEIRGRVNLLRGKANEVAVSIGSYKFERLKNIVTRLLLAYCDQANAAKYGKAPEVIDFAAYKNKLRFTGSAVASLEVLLQRHGFIFLKHRRSRFIHLFCLQIQSAYKSATYPTYTAELPAFEVKKRAMVVSGMSLSSRVFSMASIFLKRPPKTFPSNPPVMSVPLSTLCTGRCVQEHR